MKLSDLLQKIDGDDSLLLPGRELLLKIWPVLQMEFAKLQCPTCNANGKPPKQQGFSFYHPSSGGNFSLCRANIIWNTQLTD